MENPICMRCEHELVVLEERFLDAEDKELMERVYQCPHCGALEYFYPCSEEDKENYAYYNEDVEDNLGGCSHGYDGLCPQCGSHIIWGSDFMRSEILGDVEEGEVDEYGCLDDDSLASSVHCPHCGASIDVIEAKPSERKDYPYYNSVKKEMGKLIIIPDVHGRKFWHDAVKNITDDDKVVFLGDYVDPYGHEGLTAEDAICELENVIDFKKEHMNNVILLLGNHDFSYIHDNMPRCRYDEIGAENVKHLFMNNIELFDIAYTTTYGDKKYLFTHSGVHKKWIQEQADEKKLDITEFNCENMCEVLNNLLHNDLKTLVKCLAYMSYYRGGWTTHSSCIWGDVREFSYRVEDDDNSFVDEPFQIFGHSQQAKYPVIGPDYACLDCRRAFYIDEENKIVLYPLGIEYDDFYEK